MCEPESWVLLLSKNTCGVPALAGDTAFTGSGCMSPLSCGGVELDLSAWPAAGALDSSAVS